MSGHAPGPWRVMLNPGQLPEYDRILVGPNPGHFIVSMTSKDSMGTEIPENHANARLIAAAPDLLEANEVALTALEQMWKDYMSDRHPNLEQINDAMKGLRAALASAKGEG